MPDVPELVDHLFRHRYGAMVAGLCRVFGSHRLELVEDVVQEALVRALKSWAFQGVPERPEAWLVKVARNRALDVVRRSRLDPELCEHVENWASRATAQEPDQDVGDETLGMVFACCHPALSEVSQIALTLKTVCGFGVPEIARALLAKDSAVAQRLSRARSSLHATQVPVAFPPDDELPRRLHAVRRAIYLLFNEGYSARHGDHLVRRDLVEEGVRLARLLSRHPRTAQPETHALTALLCLQGARVPQRTDGFGELVVLAAQDRTRWRTAWISEGFGWLERSASGTEVTALHMEAGIAATHAGARSYAETDWNSILRQYDQLVARTESPVARVNRAVALAMVAGAEAGLEAVDELGADRRMTGYPPLLVTRAMLLWASDRRGDADLAFAGALECELPAPQRAFLEARRADCAAGAPCDLLPVTS